MLDSVCWFRSSHSLRARILHCTLGSTSPPAASTDCGRTPSPQPALPAQTARCTARGQSCSALSCTLAGTPRCPLPRTGPDKPRAAPRLRLPLLCCPTP
eukprot:2609542-Rhodomonas_salina.1